MVGARSVNVWLNKSGRTRCTRNKGLRVWRSLRCRVERVRWDAKNANIGKPNFDRARKERAPKSLSAVRPSCRASFYLTTPPRDPPRHVASENSAASHRAAAAAANERAVVVVAAAAVEAASSSERRRDARLLANSGRRVAQPAGAEPRRLGGCAASRLARTQQRPRRLRRKGTGLLLVPPHERHRALPSTDAMRGAVGSLRRLGGPRPPRPPWTPPACASGAWRCARELRAWN